MRLRPVPSMVMLFVAMAVIFGALQIKEQARKDITTKLNQDAEEKLSLVASTLSQTVSARLSHIDSLAAFVRLNPWFTQEEFSRFANFLHRNRTGILSMQVQPNGVVLHITNEEQNKGVIGHDLFADPNRKAMVERAVRDRHFSIAGPIDLVQGGKAIIARRPLYQTSNGISFDTDPGVANPRNQFWGFTTVLIDPAPLLAEAGYHRISDEFDVAIRGKDALGAEGAVFFGSESVFARSIATADVILPNGSWQIGASLPEGYTYAGFEFSQEYWYLTALIAALLAYAAYIVTDRPGRLKEAVDRATAELVEARDRAEAADKAKSEFVSVVSHELRTPLTSIRGSLDLLASGKVAKLEPKAQELIDLGARNSHRLVSLVNDILDVNKMLWGELEFEFKPVLLGDLLREAVQLNQPFAETEGVSLQLTLPVESDVNDLTIVCDRARIEQVITNVISNACKFSPRDDIVTVTAVVLENEGVVSISVADNGPGIPEEFQAKIFDRFTQVDSSDTRRAGGTGLGLFICQLIMTRHSGDIDFETRPGGGTTFSVRLPI
ncbi:MAG: ATP-binding protein [Rhodospirillales bacterium]